MMIAGAIVFAAALSSEPTTASAHGARHRHLILRGAGYVARSTRPRSFARGAPGLRRARAARFAGRGSYAVARRGHGRLRWRTARMDRRIRQYVGSQASYAPASTGGGYVQTGAASYYSLGGRTAAGGSVGPATCAHRSLPFGTKVLVTNLTNAHQAVLTVNDRGPFVRGRVIDVSKGAAVVLGMIGAGVAHVRLQVLSGGPG